MTSNFGLMPIWTNSTGNVTSILPLNEAEDIVNKLALLFLGRFSKLNPSNPGRTSNTKECRRPCTLTYVDTKFEYEKVEMYQDWPVNQLMLTFIPTVEVVTSQFKQFNLATFFTDAGGTLGLWLGLSILSLLQAMATKLAAAFDKN